MMYEGIYDMPIGRWWDLNDHGDLKSILKDPLKRVTKRIEKKLKQRYKIIKDEFFDKIALTRKMENYILKQVRLQWIRCEIMVAEKNMSRYWKTQLKIQMIDITAEQNKVLNDGRTRDDNKADLEKFRGMYIDKDKVTVSEYHSYVKQMENEYHRLKKLHLSRKARK